MIQRERERERERPCKHQKNIQRYIYIYIYINIFQIIMFSNIFNRRARVTPSKDEGKEETKDEKAPEMRVVSLHTLMKRYGCQRHPRLHSYDVLKECNEIEDYRNVPPGSTTIYISHEWVGTDHPDPDGNQMYHLLLLLERLQNGKIPRTDMDVMHTRIYKSNHTTTAGEWKRILNSEKTYIWYDGFCLPKSRRKDGFRSIPSYIRRCDFMIILAPGCTHLDRIDPRTQRRMNLCYRTYRLRARCVFELFCAFLTTRGGEKARPTLLVRSGTGTPNWTSPLECQKLAVGISSFECCEENHTTMKRCRRPLCLVILDRLIEDRARSLFQSKNYANARISLCLRNFWCRGLIDDTSRRSWDTLTDFMMSLLWRDSQDNAFVDQEGFPLLAYAAVSDSILAVQEVLKKIRDIKDSKMRIKCRRARTPKSGLVAFGITGLMSPLMIAMLASRPKIVELLLEDGADPFETDVVGLDAFMFASSFARSDNVKFWLDRFPEWNLERKNTVSGGTALGCAVYMGPHRLEVVKILLDHGASIDAESFTGSSIIMSLCECEDADPETLQYLLKHTINVKQQINHQGRGSTLKWRNILRIARFLDRNKLFSNLRMIRILASWSGITALQYAVRRGDVDVVNILLEYGADPSIKNDLGKSPVDYCDAFPELRGALKRVIKQQRGNKSVHRRKSTATNMKYPMYVVPLDQLHRLYGGKDSRHDRIEAHQELKQRGELVRWEDLPIDAHIIFLSHEWVGWNHPDPHGIQLKTFLRAMKRLRSGSISRVDINWHHAMYFKKNYVVRAEEWKEILSTAYVWIDWASMPQPSACSPSVSQDKKAKMETDLGNAVKSIPSYVEKADFVTIVAPGCLHADRRDRETKFRSRTCYRTYRNRGWCVLEIFASFLSRDKQHPVLLITSREGIPEWISSLEIQNLAVGTSNFTCCQRNHIFGEKIVREYVRGRNSRTFS